MKKANPVIAIVDDDPRLLESIENLLESAGYVPHIFSSAEAFIVSELSNMDVLITDIGMPGMNGFELCDLMKRTRPKLPVFLITGRHENVEQGRTMGASGFFRKPFDARALLAAVERVLDDRNKEGEHEA